MLPFGLWGEFSSSLNHLAMVPTAAGISFFFFGIEELAVHLEEPFSILPMQSMTNGIGLSAMEYDQWHEDNEYKILDRQATYGNERRRQKDIVEPVAEEKVVVHQQMDVVEPVAEEKEVVHRQMDVLEYTRSLKHTHSHKHEHLHQHNHNKDNIHTFSETDTRTHTITEDSSKPHYITHAQKITISKTANVLDTHEN